MDGRFGPGLPKVTDGALLFVLHILKKMRPKSQGGGRAGIVLSSSAFYNGDAGSGYSEIRKHLLGGDLVDAIVGLPDSLFYNTGIPTYIWILDNDKPAERKGKVQFIDGSGFFTRRRKALGEKRKDISRDNAYAITGLYAEFESTRNSKIFSNQDFEYELQKFDVELKARLISAREQARLDQGFAEISEADIVPKEMIAAIREAYGVSDTAQVFLDKCRKLLNESLGKVSDSSLIQYLRPVLSEDASAETIYDANGKPIFDTKSSFAEKSHIGTNWNEYLANEVAPHRPGVRLAKQGPVTGCEILWARIFARSESQASKKAINKQVSDLTTRFLKSLNGVQDV
jgi:type I restriction enzyme M protein